MAQRTAPAVRRTRPTPARPNRGKPGRVPAATAGGAEGSAERSTAAERTAEYWCEPCDRSTCRETAARAAKPACGGRRGGCGRARRAGSAAGVKDVAAAAGVSLGTVSNVLNRPEMVSPTTRAKVEAAMASLGFVRNESARQLRAGSSRIIAYLMLDAGNPFFTDVARGVEEAAQKAGLSVFLCNSNEDAAREADYLDLLEQQRVQGVLITPIDPDSPRLSKLPARGTPVVVVDRSIDDGEHCSVAVDDVLGGEVALTHLIELGHERDRLRRRPEHDRPGHRPARRRPPRVGAGRICRPEAWSTY